MGRGSRRIHQKRQFPHGAGRGNPGRLLPLLDWDESLIQKNYGDLPQGPPLLEDGEENPDAILLRDLALGQEGADARGERYQLLGWEGPLQLQKSGNHIPKFLRMRHGENFFLLPSDSKSTLERDTVFYPRFADEDLAAYGLHWGFQDSLGGGLERMKREGLWDMRIDDGQTIWYQIGPWIIQDIRGGGQDRNEYPDAQVARGVIEQVAENVEVAPLIDDFLRRHKEGTLPSEEDDTDRYRKITRLALLGLRDLQQTTEELLQASGQARDPGARVMLQVLGESLRRGPFPDRDHPEFLGRVGPVWLMTSRLQIP